MFRNLRSIVRTKQYPIAWRLINKRNVETGITPSKFPFKYVYNFFFSIGVAVVVPITFSVIFPEKASSLLRPFTWVVENYPNLKSINQDVNKLLAIKLADSTFGVDVTEDYVERKELEELITNYMTMKPSGQYYIVYGNRGVGKTSLVAKCATPTKEDPKKGYVLVNITDASSIDVVRKKLYETLQIDTTKNKIYELNKAMKEVYIKNKTYPVVVFEIDRCITDKDLDVVENIRKVAKALADGKFCNCFLVLSESNAIVQFGKDSGRETYLFVDELSISEAKTFLKKNFQTMSDEDMKTKIFDKIGTKPDILCSLVGDCKKQNISIDAFVGKILNDAKDELALFPFQSILKALKDLPNPDKGVAKRYFENLKEKDVELMNEIAVGIATKQKKDLKNVILFRKDSSTYHLISTAHKTALKTYKPKPNAVPIIRTWIEFLTGKGYFY